MGFGLSIAIFRGSRIGIAPERSASRSAASRRCAAADGCGYLRTEPAFGLSAQAGLAAISASSSCICIYIIGASLGKIEVRRARRLSKE